MKLPVCKNCTRRAKKNLILAALLIFVHINGISQSKPHLSRLDTLRAAVEANPDDKNTHQAFIDAVGLNDSSIAVQYKKWISQHPQNINIPLALGEAYYNQERPEASFYLKKVVDLDPGRAEVWSMLSFDAERWGELPLSVEYMKQASLAAPDNPDYAFYYAMTFENEDYEVYKQKLLDLAKRFPDDERGAQGLYWLAEDSENDADKIKYFEQLRSSYPSQKFRWSASGLSSLWGIYVRTDLEKASALVHEMKEDKYRKLTAEFTDHLITERKLEAAKDYPAAIAELDRARSSLLSSQREFYYQKQASLLEKSGNVKAAYDTLVTKLAGAPTAALKTLTENYGKKLSKTTAQVQEDVQMIREKSAVPAYAFDLETYSGDKHLKLTDLKGKVVLLTFWFPGCGPCRAEFPHFQKVMDKYRDNKKVVYLGINVYPDQDAYVLPFIKNTKYSFIPLRANSDFAVKNFEVQGEPTNFLIDQQGQIVFKNFRILANNVNSLDMMISSLLNKK